MDDDGQISMISALPTEVLLQIFQYLSGAQLLTCRQVCARWKQVIDDTENFYLGLCKRDYGDIYEEARLKAAPTLSWRHLYRSLNLWSKESIKEEWREFDNSYCRITGVDIRNGIIAVHKVSSIVYFDAETLEQTNTINGYFWRYEENDNLIVFMNYPPRDSNLIIAPKDLNHPRFEIMEPISEVNEFILVGKYVYYVQHGRKIYNCKFEHGFRKKFLNSIDEEVIALSYSNDHLNVLTKWFKIYTLTEQGFVLAHAMSERSNFLQQLREYNIINRFNHRLWRTYYDWIRFTNQSRLPATLFRNITAVRAYGDIVLIGTSDGVLRIYYAPFATGEFNVINTEPVKEYDFKVLFEDYEPSPFSFIRGVDVLETEKGPKVVVATQCKVLILDIIYTFNWLYETTFMARQNLELL